MWLMLLDCQRLGMKAVEMLGISRLLTPGAASSAFNCCLGVAAAIRKPMYPGLARIAV
jgi:hypothetical protein